MSAREGKVDWKVLLLKRGKEISVVETDAIATPQYFIIRPELQSRASGEPNGQRTIVNYVNFISTVTMD